MRHPKRGSPRFAILVYHHEVFNIDTGQNRDKQPMFVGTVQSVYGPNGMIPSAIRVYLVEEETAESGAEVMECGPIFARVFEPTFKFFDGLAHGELGLVSNKGGNHPLNCLEPGIVQGAIKVVNSVSHHKGELLESRRICELMYEAFCPRVRVNLNDGGICVMKRDDACFNIADMLIGPLDLETCAFAEGHLSCSDCAVIGT